MWNLLNNRSTYPRCSIMYPSNAKEVEAQKVVAEKLNGRFAMLGIIAALGAYFTTGQIIPGFV